MQYRSRKVQVVQKVVEIPQDRDDGLLGNLSTENLVQGTVSKVELYPIFWYLCCFSKGGEVSLGSAHGPGFVM